MDRAPGRFAVVSKVQKCDPFPKNSIFRKLAYARMATGVSFAVIPMEKPDSRVETAMISLMSAFTWSILIPPGPKLYRIATTHEHGVDASTVVNTMVKMAVKGEGGVKKRCALPSWMPSCSSRRSKISRT